MNPIIYYTALNTFDSTNKTGFSWGDFINFSELTHLKELVSLDSNLNRLSFMPDLNAIEEWDYFITEQERVLFYFNSIDYVLEKVKDLQTFNLLAIVKQPTAQKADIANSYDFVGYDLIEIGGDTSALSNGGGFDETFLPNQLNEFGLITDYNKATQIQKELPKNNPDNQSAECYLFEVWRHKLIGRKTN